MNPVTFHKDVYLPDYVAIQVDKLSRRIKQLRYGPHSLLSTTNDKYGIIKHYELPTTLHFLELIEVEVYDGMVSKVVMRKMMKDGRWLAVVVGDNGFVRTLWSNLPGDTHETLRRDRYVQGMVDSGPSQMR